MNCLLDTNVCVVYLKGKRLNLKQRFEAVPVSEIAVCSVVKAELCFGAMKSVTLQIPEDITYRTPDTLNLFNTGLGSLWTLIACRMGHFKIVPAMHFWLQLPPTFAPVLQP
jgi:predicted nucleic acid-binding protein